jgi:predicted glycosyltransferase
VSLEETFARTKEIEVPVVYTGFVTPRPDGREGMDLKNRLGIQENATLVVASAGGGNVGSALLEAVLKAHELLVEVKPIQLHIFTGPFMAEDEFFSLKKRAGAGAGVRVERFTGEFLSFLAGADLAISMAGYNTCMNILVTGVPALVWPFAQNREQRMRAEKLAAMGALSLLEDHDLEPSRLAGLIMDVLSRPRSTEPLEIDLEGSAETARWLEAWCSQKVTG